jgi:hypothetical protein
MFLNFVNSNTLDSRITFTRTTTATVTNSSGVIQSSAINSPRFDYDPVTLQSKGLLIEEQRINLLLNSFINGTSLSTQSVTVAAVAHTISFYGTGTITLTGAAVATVTGTGVYPNRQTLTFTPIAGVLVCTVSGSVQYAQLEAGAFATSFIPTAGATVTRSPDDANMTGTNYSSWYNPTAGTLSAQFSFLSRTLTGTTPIVYNGSANGRWSYLSNASARMFDATNTATAGNIATPTAVNKTASALSSAGMAISLNGAAPGTSAYVGTFGSQDALNIGNGAGVYINGHIRQIIYYNTRLPNTTLRVLTV